MKDKPNNINVINTEASELPTFVICEWLKVSARSAPEVDGNVLSEAAKRLDNRYLHNAHLHHPDCAYWTWDWNHSWHSSDCTCITKLQAILKEKDRE